MFRGANWLCSVLLISVLVSLAAEISVYAADDEKFKEYEVRVIRPRLFTKAGQFELGAQLTAIMNETFVYTYLGTGILTYHFSESWGFEANGSFGFSIEREEKRVLFDEFEIRTQIFRTLYSFEGALLWTPIYGKWQLPSGKLIYFDTYLAGGAGMTGIDWKYSDFCVVSQDSNGATNEIPGDKVASYPTFLFGLGQRYRLDQDSAIKWDLRFHGLMYNTGDTSCDVNNTEGGGDIHYNVTMALGASKFF